MMKCNTIGHPSDCAGDAQSPHEPTRKQVTVYEHLGLEEPLPVTAAKSAPNPRHLSKADGHRTPPDIVERARAVLGGFDLDPFSSAAANEVVKAAKYFSGITGDLNCVLDHEHGPGQTCHGPPEAVDGFEETWRGCVFCNPPGGKFKNQSNQKRAWFRLAEKYLFKYVPSAFFVCFSVELLQTTQSKTPDGPPIPLDFPICYPKKRIAYVRPDGSIGRSPPHASCFVLLPERLSDGSWSMRQLDNFVSAFSDIGRVVIPRVYK